MNMAWTRRFVATTAPCLMLAACSSPVPPPSQANVTISLTNPLDTSGGQVCQANNTPLNIPLDNKPKAYSASGHDRSSNRAVDGDNGYNVSCLVQPDGDKFHVVASTSYLVKDASGTHSGSLSFQIQDIGPNDTSVSGKLSVTSDMWDVSFTTNTQIRDSSNCNFSVSATATDSSLGIAPGRIWARADCTSLVSADQPNVGCDAKQTYLVFENCDH